MATKKPNGCGIHPSIHLKLMIPDLHLEIFPALFVSAEINHEIDLAPSQGMKPR